MIKNVLKDINGEYYLIQDILDKKTKVNILDLCTAQWEQPMSPVMEVLESDNIKFYVISDLFLGIKNELTKEQMLENDVRSINGMFNRINGETINIANEILKCVHKEESPSKCVVDFFEDIQCIKL